MAVAILFFPAFSFGQKAVVDGVVYSLSIYSQDATIYSRIDNQLPDTLIIPKSIEYQGSEYVVRSDLYPAFKQAKMKVLIWEADCSIKEKNFYNCPNLTTIIIKGQVEDIENEAFSYCTNLEKITFNEGLTYIGRAAFEGCSSIKEITVPASVTMIDVRAFSECSSLKKVVIKNKNLENEVNRYTNMLFKNTPFAQVKAQQPAGKRKPNQAVTNDSRFKVNKKTGVVVY